MIFLNRNECKLNEVFWFLCNSILIDKKNDRKLNY